MKVPRRLLGMQDRGPRTLLGLNHVSNRLESFLSAHGYMQMDVPVLEETELFLRKSGGELASKMYTFSDPGGYQVSLRPEFTASVVRAYLEGLNDGPLPVRWQYQGPVFRYDTEEIQAYRQFNQVGAELIGVSGARADAEVLALAAQGLTVLGVRRHSLVIGHLGFISVLLESLGISDRARMLLLASISDLRLEGSGYNVVQDRAISLGLLPSTGGSEGIPASLARDEVIAFVERFDSSEALPPFGVRDIEEIRERYLRKQRFSEDTGRFSKALNVLSRVAQVRGDPEDAILRVREIIGREVGNDQLERLEETFHVLSSYDLGIPVTMDFGLARGIAYYAGIVFEIQHLPIGDGNEALNDIGLSLGGGGRYDGLVHALGGPEDTAAMGFAWTLEQTMLALSTDCVDAIANTDELKLYIVRAIDSKAHHAAVKEAQRLRTQRIVVELELSQRSVNECLRYARARGAYRVLSVNSDGIVKEENITKRTTDSTTRRS
jgi:histidyl-tRNA synthetase